MTPARRSRPLDGVRVLDLSRVLSGPSCGKVLADLGADVVKLEPPEGDLTRTAQPRRGGVAVYFAQQNCGKRCISVDLAHDAGRALAVELARRSDVVLENYRPGVTARLGVGYEDVREGNPGVVYCSISGYGQDGPEAGRRAYAPVLHAELGLMEFTARRRGTAPVAEAVSHGDLYTGLQAAIGILAALRHRDRTGEGQHVDVSMAESMLAASEWTAVELAGGEGGRFHVFGGFNAPVLTLGDGTVVCVPGDPVATFPAWCRAMERDDLLADERFSTPEARDASRAAMTAVLTGFAAGFDRFVDFEAAIGRSRMAAGVVRSVAEAAVQPWADARGAVVEVDAGGERVALPRSPVRFSGLDAGTHGRPAWQGEHNREVLSEVLGLSGEEIDRLERDGVLVSRPPSS